MSFSFSFSSTRRRAVKMVFSLLGWRCGFGVGGGLESWCYTNAVRGGYENIRIPGLVGVEDGEGMVALRCIVFLLHQVGGLSFRVFTEMVCIVIFRITLAVPENNDMKQLTKPGVEK
jgi:hypothetical protein